MVKHKKMKSLELINHLESIGVKFNIIGKAEAIRFIEKNNYYYKVASFRKNFKKINGNYTNLEFAYLKDLATIDMYVRDVLLDIAINVEHFIRVEISRLLNNNQNEDGYTIIDEFMLVDEGKFYTLTLQRFRQSRYQQDMYTKRNTNIPYWVLIEHMDFGCLLKFVELYYNKYEPKSLKKAVILGKYAKYIRNACAHNSVFTINIFSEDNKLNNVSATITTIAQQNRLIKYKNYKKVNDFLSLLALSKAYCSEAVLKHQKRELYELITRCERMSVHYKKNVTLTKMLVIFKRSLDIL